MKHIYSHVIFTFKFRTVFIGFQRLLAAIGGCKNSTTDHQTFVLNTYIKGIELAQKIKLVPGCSGIWQSLSWRSWLHQLKVRGAWSQCLKVTLQTCTVSRFLKYINRETASQAFVYSVVVWDIFLIVTSSLIGYFIFLACTLRRRKLFALCECYAKALRKRR